MGTQIHFLPLTFYSQSASFRLPEEHTFQSTLPLPSVTALTGLLGAALGLNFKDAMVFRQENECSFAVYGTSMGYAKDLWKHKKIKSKETKSSILTREVLFHFWLELLIAAENINTLHAIREAFASPYYALSLGTSDDIAKLIHIGKIETGSVGNITKLENTCLKGDFSGKYRSEIRIQDIPLNKKIYPPKVYFLPTQYSFNDGVRTLAKKEPFTFVTSPVILEEAVQGIEYDGKGFPLF